VFSVLKITGVLKLNVATLWLCAGNYSPDDHPSELETNQPVTCDG